MASDTTQNQKATTSNAAPPGATLSAEPKTSEALVRTHCKDSNTQGITRKIEQSVSVTRGTREHTYQEIRGVGADTKGKAAVGFLNAAPDIACQIIQKIHAGETSVAYVGVVNPVDDREPQQRESCGLGECVQVIKGINATGGSAIAVGYVNTTKEDFRKEQQILDVTAKQEGVVVAGVGRNIDLNLITAPVDFGVSLLGTEHAGKEEFQEEENDKNDSEEKFPAQKTSGQKKKC